MYHGLFTQDMADDFIEKHLLNPDEFFTYLPLPNIAANDPVFFVSDEVNNFTPEIKRLVKENQHGDFTDNSWSGPVQGLIYQRTIDALLNYGHHAELTYFGRKWLNNLTKEKIFVQQYDPFSGKASPGVNGYGPTMLAALEYINHIIGVDYASDHFTFSSGKYEADSEFSQHLFGDDYLLKRENGTAYVYKNGEMQFSFTSGARIICDSDLNVLNVVCMEQTPQLISINLNGETFTKTLSPNEFCKISNGKLVTEKTVRFDMKI